MDMNKKQSITTLTTAIALALLFALSIAPSCSSNKEGQESSGGSLVYNPSTDGEGALRDSLDMAKSQNEALSSLMDEVTGGMDDILGVERMVTAQELGNAGATTREEVQNKINSLKELLDKRTERLNEIEKALANAEAQKALDDAAKARMLLTIGRLREQIRVQQDTIDELNRRLNAAQQHINTLNERVDSLKFENRIERREKEIAQREADHATQQVNELQECYYVIGSKKELKAHKILETGFLRKTKILENDFSRSYFTVADKRTLNDISLHSKKAKVLTKHPKNSYYISDSAGEKVLRIVNPDSFWEFSNYLVVQVD